MRPYFVLAGNLALSILFVGVSVMLAQNAPWTSFMAAVVFGIFAVSSLGDIVNIGIGRVPKKVEKLSARLRDGLVYEMVHYTNEDVGYVVMLRRYGTPELRTVRIESLPPKIFTLVAGKSIAIMPQSA